MKLLTDSGFATATSVDSEDDTDDDTDIPRFICSLEVEKAHETLKTFIQKSVTDYQDVGELKKIFDRACKNINYQQRKINF